MSRPWRAAQHRHGVDLYPASPDLEVEMWSGGVPGASDQPDDLAFGQLLSGFDPELGEVGIHCQDVVIVVEPDHETEVVHASGEADPSVGHGRHRCPSGHKDVNASVETGESAVPAHAEGCPEGCVNRPTRDTAGCCTDQADECGRLGGGPRSHGPAGPSMALPEESPGASSRRTTSTGEPSAMVWIPSGITAKPSAAPRLLTRPEP